MDPSSGGETRPEIKAGHEPRVLPSSVSLERQATFMRRLGRIREQQPAVSQPGRASRYSKVVTWIAIPCSIFYAVFIQDWGPHEHVFSGPQRWYKRQKEAFWAVPGETRSSETQR